MTPVKEAFFRTDSAESYVSCSLTRRLSARCEHDEKTPRLSFPVMMHKSRRLFNDVTSSAETNALRRGWPPLFLQLGEFRAKCHPHSPLPDPWTVSTPSSASANIYWQPSKNKRSSQYRDSFWVTGALRWPWGFPSCASTAAYRSLPRSPPRSKTATSTNGLNCTRISNVRGRPDCEHRRHFSAFVGAKQDQAVFRK